MAKTASGVIKVRNSINYAQNQDARNGHNNKNNEGQQIVLD